jgi:lipocalin-like protein
MQQFITDKIIGTWKLDSWVYQNEHNEKVDFFGPNPVGILMYEKSGYMNAQLMRSDRANFISTVMGDGTTQEYTSAFNGYAAYFGKFEEREPGTLTHIVEGSLYPNWVGQDEIRYGKVEGNTLTLSAPGIINGEKIMFYVTWKRVLRINI